MTTRRDTQIHRDYRILDKLGDATLHDSGSRIIIHNFNYPDGWTPQTEKLLIRYPEHYPRMQPAIYLPREMSYSGRVRHFQQPEDSLADDWIRWCIHYIPWEQFRASRTRAQSIPIADFIGLVGTSLAAPHLSDPIEAAEPQAHR